MDKSFGLAFADVCGLFQEASRDKELSRRNNLLAKVPQNGCEHVHDAGRLPARAPVWSRCNAFVSLLGGLQF